MLVVEWNAYSTATFMGHNCFTAVLWFTAHSYSMLEGTEIYPSWTTEFQSFCLKEDCESESAVANPLCKSGFCLDCLTSIKKNPMQAYDHITNCTCIDFIALMDEPAEDRLLSEEDIDDVCGECFESEPTAGEKINAWVGGLCTF